ncbi:hypothetical protein [Marinicella gelatinilytica]|uniref:hypothetical protein n=1 Tax=Marinicella gelatinilytica TaxID=2996017 RepID=UPI002260D3B7|nr:hypothetical protein [Marinicella gelatinilytica]MCX7544077.1 hypothetical protein [Marinicella gelatinilytica]
MKKTLIMMVLTGLVLSACNREETTDDIDQKAVDRWQALIDGDFEKAYEYLAPSYAQLETLNSYSLRMSSLRINLEWKSIKFNKKECSDDACEVLLELTYEYSFPKSSMGKIESIKMVKENWLKSEDKWFFMPDDQKKI